MLATLSDATVGTRSRFSLPSAAPGPARQPNGAEAPTRTRAVAGYRLDASSIKSSVVHFGRGEQIIAQGDEPEYCFQIIAGCARTVSLLEDGRRLVGEFLFPGDVAGWETSYEHGFSVETITPATMRRFVFSAMEERAEHDAEFARRLRHYMTGQVRLANDRILFLARKTAAERVAGFLLDMRSRVGAGGENSFELPMGRSDMADYLGLTIETVSRTLTAFHRRGIVTIDRSHIGIRDDRQLLISASDHVH